MGYQTCKKCTLSFEPKHTTFRNANSRQDIHSCNEQDCITSRAPDAHVSLC